MPSPPRTPVACGVDIGSTNLKVIALNADGQVLARTHRPTPRGREDPSLDVDLLRRVVEDMLVEVCGTDLALHVVAVAGVGEDGVLLDSRFQALGPALAWFDPRRQGIFRAVRPHLTQLADVGVVADPARTVVGWTWARTLPSSERAATWVAVTDHLATVWTGHAWMSDTVAARTAAWDVRQRRWVSEHVRATLGDEDLLPTVVVAGTPVGDLHSERLAAAGVLTPDAQVVVGGHDHPVGGWAVDRLHPGALLDSMGTAEVVVAQIRTQVHETGDVDVAPGIGEACCTLLSVAELGRNVAWASQDPSVAHEISQIAAGRVDPDDWTTSGTFVPGRRGGGRPHYTIEAPLPPRSRASAVLGELARTGGTAAVLEISRHLPPGTPVYASGGWSRAPGWLRLKERFTGPLRLVGEPEVTAVGAALLAATAVGWPVPAEVSLAGTAGTRGVGS